MMEKWTAFLNSLATRGGAIVILMLIVGLVDLGAFTMYLRHDVSAENLKDIISTGAFSGALLLALKGSSDSSASVTGPSGTATASTAPVSENAQAVAKTQP